MNLSFITTKPPTLSSGSEVRNYYLLKSFLESPHIKKVNLIYINSMISEDEIKIFNKKLNIFVFSLKDRNVLESIQSYLSGEIPYVTHLKKNTKGREILKLLSDSDVIFLSELDGYFVVSDIIPELSKNKRIILDCHNIDSERFNSEISSSPLYKKVLSIPIQNSLKNSEIEALSNVDLVLCCSDVEKKYFSTYKNTDLVKVVPNGVQVKSFVKNDRKFVSHELLFMGLLSYGPNSDAINYYLSKIHPLVLDKVADYKITILGKNPPDWLIKIAQDNNSINLMGFVESVEKYLNRVDVCICPLRYGSGTRLKILEYMVSGKAVVSTTIGSEGIDVEDGENILIADDPRTFVEMILSLLNNKKQILDLGLSARKLTVEKYNWDIIGKELIQILKNLK